MHGTITLERDGTRHAFTLEDDGTWTIDPALPAAELARVRTALDRVVSEYRGPSAGAFGPGELDRAASYLRLYYAAVAVRVEPREPMPPGTVY